MSLIELLHLSSPRTAELPRDAVGLIALGAVEQHGPHLPIATDMLIARGLAERVARAMPRPVVLLPAPVGGLSQHHVAFPGTVSLDADTLAALLDALVAMSTRIGLSRLAVFSAHGGNFAFLGDYAARRPVEAFSDLEQWFRVAGSAAADCGLTVAPTDEHAGALETSQALDLLPALVGDTTGVRGLIDADPNWKARMWTQGIQAVSPTGVLGDPRRATTDAGAAINEALTQMLVSWLSHCFGDPDVPRP